KKKRGRPKGSKNQPTKPKAEAKVEEQQFETKIGETKPEKQTQKEPKASTPKKEEPTQASTSLVPGRIAPADSFTDKYRLNRIFRREMGEPEFFLIKNERAPSRPILSKDDEEEISRKVQIPTDQTPKYAPENMISPEFGGLTNYERGIEDHKQELEEKLKRLKENPDASAIQIEQIEEELRSLDYLYENYNIGMNVFRTAKGGRSKLHA
ncbi:MAG: hypothetical protein ACE5EJ_04600, partial [Nitrosopumilaceae archaeon]